MKGRNGTEGPAAGNGRLYSVTTGSYPAPEFNGGNSASNVKAPLSAACPLETAELLKSSRSIRRKSVV
jgi:hypothetical protein